VVPGAVGAPGDGESMRPRTSGRPRAAGL